jgi:preprotein translocase subunit YajC
MQEIIQKLGSIPPLLGLGALMYFMVIRPQQQRARQHQNLLAGLNPGDHVTTSSGIVGVVDRLEPTIVHLKIASGVVITLERVHIAKINPSMASSEPAQAA